MQIEELVKLYASHAGVKAFEKTWGEGVRSVFLRGLAASSPEMFFSALVRSGSLKGCPVLFFTLRDVEEASYFYHDLAQLLGDGQVLFFPSSYKRAIKYRQKDDAAEVLRTEVLTRLTSLCGPSEGNPLLIVSFPDALAEGVVTQKDLQKNTLHLSVGQTIDATELTEELFRLGFQRTDYVYEPGQFALRGSIVDVFSFSSELPFRIDFFGDDIDSIRTFEVESQLSRSKSDDIYITPELTAEGKDYASVLDFLPQSSALVFRSIADVCDRVEAVNSDVLSIHIGEPQQRERGVPPSGQPPLISREAFLHSCAAFRRIEIGSHPTGEPEATISFDVSAQPVFHKNFDMVSTSFADYIAHGYRLYILSDSPKQCERLRTIFDERGEWDDGTRSGIGLIHFVPVDKTIHEGFADNTLHCCLFTDHQIFDRFHKYSLRSDKARQGKVAVSLKELAQFEIGDYVVHIDHGIGRFAGLVRIPNGDSTQEAIKLIYEGARGGQDVVLVSIHSLHKISKYKGKEGTQPRMSRLGTGAWEKMKERTKTKIKDIARDLILLYSKRLHEPGFAFSPDSFLQHELEAGFIYEDTPDQLKATQDVKADMEQARPMDRLICGDVGFGKTEVAIRAAFKACADNKQVAVLVPTTVLAYQHFQTFTERLRNFPCRVEYLSRARSAGDVKKILSDLSDGKIDIIVGTHKLIGKNVKFKDLGLLIIDEEQKFGVSVKEKLKQMKVNVDTLTLTATPIPRTLQFSLMGARDLSIMQTPPPNRYPIQTEVHTFNEDIIRDAINYEMSRNGQTFFINNRVQNLPELAALVKRLVPDARIAIGHGQMEPEQLENIILGFINYDYDVLIATSIVENGIDIPNANTIIINQAHMFGLSDLHQMRGRVGRTNRRAFCYLLAPPYSLMTDEAHRRLVAIENFTDLGSGIHIAMQDLDIRGAGNLLGAEQSGFIADLGYETYQKILEEAVHELKAEEFTDLFEKSEAEERSGQLDAVFTGEDFVQECTFESDLELLFPDEYIPSSGERILIYRELDSLETDDQLSAFRSRLEDRFGRIPREGEELMKVVPLRRLARKLGVEKLVLKTGRMVLYFVGQPDSPYYQSEAFGRIIAFSTVCPNDCQFRQTGGKQNLLIKDVTSVATALELLKRI